MMGYVIIAVLLTISAIILGFIVSSLGILTSGGVPYVPSKKRDIDDLFSLVDLSHIQKAVDLGSGDGRIVIALAKKGIEAHGYELHPFFYILSLFNVWRSGVRQKAHIHFGNFFHISLSSYDLITIYAISYIMSKVEEKIKKEKKKSAKVVSIKVQFPTMKLTRNKNHVFLYS